MTNEKKSEKIEYKPQIYPGADEVSERRRKYWIRAGEDEGIGGIQSGINK